MMKSSGVTLLLAVFIMGVSLTIATGVFTLILGELRIGEGASQSVFAFYAADSGAECVLYWDLNGNKFATSSGPGSNLIDCVGNTISVGGWDHCDPSQCTAENQGRDGLNVFTLNFDDGSCTDVTVDKKYSGNNLVTTITSFGKNDCSGSGVRVVERGLRVILSRP